MAGEIPDNGSAGPVKVLFWQKRYIGSNKSSGGNKEEEKAAAERGGGKRRRRKRSSAPESLCRTNSAFRTDTKPARHKARTTQSSHGTKPARHETRTTRNPHDTAPARHEARTARRRTTEQTHSGARRHSGGGKSRTTTRRPEPPNTKRAGLRFRRPDDTARKPYMTRIIFARPGYASQHRGSSYRPA